VKKDEIGLEPPQVFCHSAGDMKKQQRQPAFRRRRKMD
jgi:hypothetical protein